MTSAGEGDKPSFERDIGPLFRTSDRDSMTAAFDLFGYVDLVEHAAQVDKLKQWIGTGLPA